MFKTPRLTRRRMALALVIALAADALQIPTQFTPPVQGIIDVVAMILTSLALGFHVLLLPTFVIELFPIVDMAPTWTGCVLAVIALRRNRSEPAPVSTAPPVSVGGELEVVPDAAKQNLPPKLPPTGGV